MSTAALQDAILAELRAARTSDGRHVGLRAGALCAACGGSTAHACPVCTRQRAQIAALALGGRSLRGIAQATGLAPARVQTVLDQLAEHHERVQTRRALFAEMTVAGGVDVRSLHTTSRNKLRAGAAIPTALLRAKLDALMAETGASLSDLGSRCGYPDYSQFARLLGYAPQSATVRNGRRYGGEMQRTIAVDTAAHICDALDIAPHTIPGL